MPPGDVLSALCSFELEVVLVAGAVAEGVSALAGAGRDGPIPFPKESKF